MAQRVTSSPQLSRYPASPCAVCGCIPQRMAQLQSVPDKSCRLAKSKLWITGCGGNAGSGGNGNASGPDCRLSREVRVGVTRNLHAQTDKDATDFPRAETPAKGNYFVEPQGVQPLSQPEMLCWRNPVRKCCPRRICQPSAYSSQPANKHLPNKPDKNLSLNNKQ